MVAHNNTLLALLVSNNFAEIKSSVFKRFSKDNVQVMVYSGKIISKKLKTVSQHYFRNKSGFSGMSRQLRIIL